MAKCQLEHFASLLAPELQAFILARHPKYTKKCELSRHKKPRTALADAKGGAQNIVSLAFEVRNNKSKLLVPAATDTSTCSQTPSPNKEFPPVIRVLAYSSDKASMQPSAILDSPSMLSTMCAIFDPRDRMQRVDFSVRPYTLRMQRLLEKQTCCLQL